MAGDRRAASACALPVEPVERLALEIEQLLELLAHLGQRAAEIDLAVARAHRLPQLLEKVVEPEHADALELEALMAQPVERLLHVVRVRQVLGQLVEDLLGREPNLLRAVPRGVTDDEHQER